MLRKILDSCGRNLSSQENDPFIGYRLLGERGVEIIRSAHDLREFNKIERQIQSELHLHHRWPVGSSSLDRIHFAKIFGEELRAVREVPDLPFVFMFHGDGRIRQEALLHLQGPLPAPANVYGLFWRLNDWVPEVKQAAHVALERVLPQTSAEVITPALTAILPHFGSWRRWGREGPEAVRKALCRPDVASQLLAKVGSTRQARVGEVFRELCRYKWIDQHLADVFLSAPLPHIRTMALDMLLSQKTRWLTGKKVRVWTDRSMGEYRTERAFQEREISVAFDIIELLQAGASDRSAMVRRRAADGLIDLRHNVDLKKKLNCVADILGNDSNIGVKNRIEYFYRKQPEEKDRNFIE